MPACLYLWASCNIFIHFFFFKSIFCFVVLTLSLYVVHCCEVAFCSEGTYKYFFSYYCYYINAIEVAKGGVLDINQR